MKAQFIALAIFGSLPSVAQQTDKAIDDSPRAQMRRLLAELPSPNNLSYYRDILKSGESPRGKDELEYARQAVARTVELVPKIRALIKPGTSMFDYPGLLAAGRIDYREHRQLSDGTIEGSYEFYLGYWTGGQGTGPSEFRLRFNEKGIITEFFVRKWKK